MNPTMLGLQALGFLIRFLHYVMLCQGCVKLCQGFTIVLTGFIRSSCRVLFGLHLGACV